MGDSTLLGKQAERRRSGRELTPVDPERSRESPCRLSNTDFLLWWTSEGVIRIYDPAANVFGAFNATGTTRTFFTPKRGIDYWLDQLGIAPWSPGS